ncbi:MAG TPA: hypothetical protein VG722_09125, partial [Tepidisphaeraceae bacterium]|nr:hypothetical protein [Tepidisphaeraceae bacterium]
IVQQLSIGSGATLDIGDDELIAQYTSGNSPASTIQTLLASGQNGGYWNGTGIISSDITLGTAVGYYDDGSEVTVRRSWKGDANLDGVINADDLSLISLGQALNQTAWQYGNFNYDAHVNGDDWLSLSLGIAVSQGQYITPTGTIAPSAPSAPTIESRIPGSASNLLDVLSSADFSLGALLGKGSPTGRPQFLAG